MNCLPFTFNHQTKLCIISGGRRLFTKIAFSEEDTNSIQLRPNKQYGTKIFLKEFFQKGWSLGGLKKLIRMIDTTGTAARRSGSGFKRTLRTVDNINVVEALVLS